MQTPDSQTPSSLVPPEAYLYFPKIDNSRHPSIQRNIFDGNTQFNDYENQTIRDFRSYADKHNYSLKAMWTDNMILRFLYANNFKMSKTLTSIKEHTIWRETALPVQVDEPLQKVLNSGLLYVHGRDHEFRPIVIFNVFLLDPKKVDVELITRALTYWFEYVIDEYMLPGQIENWVFIADVKGMGVGTLMLPSIRKLFGYLQDNYKCRLHTLYILNVTTALYAPWQVIKRFLDEVTVKKIQICKGQIPAGLLDETNPEQVEQKYGGSAKNATQFWPSIIPSNNYFITPRDSEALVSEEKYIFLYRSGSLSNMRVDKTRIRLPDDTPMGQINAQNFHQRASSVGVLTGYLTQDVSPLYKSDVLPKKSQTMDDTVTVYDDDYFDYFNERMEENQREMVMREFQSSFFTKLSSSH